jgi:hypothetical protein
VKHLVLALHIKVLVVVMAQLFQVSLLEVVVVEQEKSA